MKKQAIIPLFIPHLGCPHDCVFCNQKTITAWHEDMNQAKIIQLMDSRLADLAPLGLHHIEAAFYGGSFTGLPLLTQEELLSAVSPYKKSGRIQKIRLSTRPDYISTDILDMLRSQMVDIIELGAQSFDDQVLNMSGRGHTAKQTEDACRMIKEAGFELGIQLMVGLPSDNKSKALCSVLRTVDMKPDFVRIYPTVVLSGSKLADEYMTGRYVPLSQSEAVDTVKEMVRIFDKNQIPVIRIGLKSTDNISAATDLSGMYHPAFRQLVESSLAYDDILSQLDGLDVVSGVVVLSANPASFSNLAGHKGCNKQMLKSRYPLLRFAFLPDERIAERTYVVRLLQKSR